MTKIGNKPVKFQLGIEYSVVRQHDFGQVAQIKLNIIPVISSLVRNPLFGHKDGPLITTVADGGAGSAYAE